MNLLLAFDDSECSAAALAALLEQFPPDRTAVRVIHVLGSPCRNKALVGTSTTSGDSQVTMRELNITLSRLPAARDQSIARQL